MSAKKNTIQVEDLVTGYTDRNRRIPVTDSVTASLRSGELTCLLGPNGAGKSTLLKTLSAFLPPLSGKILINGRDLDEYPAEELAKVIGVVLTERLSLANMSVEELIGLGRSPYTGFWGALTESDRQIVDEAIALVKIENLRHRAINTLSDGERQKVMIAKTLAQETPVIFLDEPTAFLDYPSKVEIMQLLQSLSRLKDKTVFLSTHDLELALQIADRVWLIDKPHGVIIGTPEDLAFNGELGRYFDSDGVRFDPVTGLFCINRRPDRHIRLIGDNGRRTLVARALARNGIAIIEPADESIADNDSDTCTVEITAYGYRLNNDSILPTVEALIDAMDDIM